MEWIKEGGGFNEAFGEDDFPRPHYEPVLQMLGTISEREILRRAGLP